MSRPRILDLCCCQGGASRGYVDAGFDVVGVDINPQPRYPFDFVKADAIAVLLDHHFIQTFDAIHASFPCQAFLTGTLSPAIPVPDLVTPGRALLNATGLPWVMENVMSAPLDEYRSVYLCGGMFGLRTYRHRRFEYGGGFTLEQPVHPKHVIRTAHKARRAAWDAGLHASITGDTGTYMGPEAMGITWMSGNGLSEAIPPAYTERVGRRLLAHIEREKAA